jgi:hypothetical protein
MNKNDEIPVVIFVYKRLETLKSLLDSLLQNEEAQKTDLIFFSDGPKSLNEEILVEDVRKYISNLEGFQSVTLHTRSSNIGLAKSFLEGVSQIFVKFEKAIFLEDDNLVSERFLSFMNIALQKYEDSENVGCISGFSYPTPYLKRKPYFLKGAETWSFATWRRVWDSFEMDPIKLKMYIDQSNKKFELNMYGFDFYKMLVSQIDGTIDSWGVRWWANAVCQDLLCFYPRNPYCINIGWGLESTHIQRKTRLHYEISKLAIDRNVVWPLNPRPSRVMYYYLRTFNAKEKIKSFLYNVFINLKRKL